MLMSMKKEASGRRSAKVEVEDLANQSAAERRSAEAELGGLIDKLVPAHRRLSPTRFIDLEAAATLARLKIASLIDEAIALNSVPFATAGRGSVVIRSTSAKKVA
jgi:hypothetical protein